MSDVHTANKCTYIRLFVYCCLNMTHSPFIYPGNLLMWVMSICLLVLNLSPQYTLHKIHMQMALRSTCFQLHNHELVNEQMISISHPKSYGNISECNNVSKPNLPQTFVVSYNIAWYDIFVFKIMPSVWRIEAGLCNTKLLVDTNDSDLQYIPRNMHTVFALLCFVVVIHGLIFPYPSGLLHWHCGNLTIAPVPAKQPWWIWINTSCEFITNDCITKTKQSTTKPCAYFLGYTVWLTYSTQGQGARWTASPRDYICGHLRATCVCVCWCWWYLFWMI